MSQDTQSSPLICFIGAGNMAQSLIGGLLADGWQADHIRASDPSAEQRAAVASRYNIACYEDNAEALGASARMADIVVLAVKPQLMKPVCEELANTLRDTDQAGTPLFISIAAGIRSTDMDRWLGGDAHLVRCMPNTPALVQSGATGLYANAATSSHERDLAETVLRAVGITVWVDSEAQLDAVTAISGSGPAYFFYVIEALQRAGEDLQLKPEQARLLALQTAFGAARMALESPDDAQSLRQRVTSPGGTTEKALEALQHGKLMEIFAKATQAAANRAAEMADIFGNES